MKLLITICLLLGSNVGFSQVTNPLIKLVNPLTENNNVNISKQYIVGSISKDCELMINGKNVKVYSTGAFAIETDLIEGDTSFTLVAISKKGQFSIQNDQVQLFYS